ncbi:hypothetical protein PSTT_03064 [Puccinia striiformis]|uniref:Retrovirus-related Pol polyprotein from transposon TNT 1-94-like beta-barrel domain-containing protein n=1 Tax=Puccinia striiformis TaxID=27350 RepID=A0A2S4VXU1_9BASI|nr:hypothetical protein PSTT_03064 [Puccinia striiformis]
MTVDWHHPLGYDVHHQTKGNPINMSVQRSPTTSGTRPNTRSTARMNNNTREELSEDEGDQTLNPRTSEDGNHYIQPTLDSRRSQSSIIRDALSRFGPGDLLKLDGSNFRTWYRELVEIAFSYLDNAEFFMREQIDSPMERVARSILLGSVNRSLRHELYDSRTSFGMVQILRTRFRTINRAAQLNRWSRLHRINISLESNIPGLATTYRNAYADFLESGLDLTEDNILGLLLQSSIRNNTDLWNEFDNRVDTVLSWNQDRPLSFNRLIDILISSQQRVNDRLGDQRQETTPVAYSAETANQDRQDSIISHPDNIYAQAARPSRPLPNRSGGTRACFRCGSTSHMIICVLSFACYCISILRPRFMSTEADTVNLQLPFPLTEESSTIEMAQSSNNDGFRQAMLKTALETTPQLSEENYSIWKDKMTALLELRGVLTTLEATDPEALPLAAETNAELKLLFIAKMDSLTHSNIVTTDNRGSAKALWKAIKDRFASDESSNRARVFNEFLYVKFKEDALESFITDIKVAIKKLVDVGIDLPQDILAYLILFKLPDSLQLLKRQIMHSDKALTVQFVCNHLTQFNNENRAETKEPSSSNQAALVSTRSQRSYRNNENRAGQPGSGSSGGPKRCTTGYHNPKQDTNHSSDSCWHLHPDKAPDWWQEAQAKWQANKNVNYYMSLITLWTDSDSPRSKIVLDSGASAHIFNDTKFFDKLELGDRDVIRTGKKDATLPIKGIGRVVLQWGNSIISLEGCLYVPDIVINLISSGGVIEKGCQIVANQHGFKVSKGELNLFGGKIDNNLFTVTNPDAVGGSINVSPLLVLTAQATDKTQ